MLKTETIPGLLPRMASRYSRSCSAACLLPRAASHYGRASRCTYDSARVPTASRRLSGKVPCPFTPDRRYFWSRNVHEESVPRDARNARAAGSILRPRAACSVGARVLPLLFASMGISSKVFGAVHQADQGHS